MALIKCPECGKEISDRSRSCIHCGYPLNLVVESTNETIKNDDTDLVKDEVIQDESNQNPTQENDSMVEHNNASTSMDKKTKYGLFAIISIVIVIFIVVMISENAKKCELSSCNNPKVTGSKYCSEHTCKVEGCTLSKSKYDNYCFIHQKEYVCAVEGCENEKVDGGDYCSEHTCEESGCYNKKEIGSNYCTEHQVDMREKLGNEFSFEINSAGGIELSFRAKNNSGKEINYIRFYVDLYNAVDDKIEDEIKDTSSVYVEITGPIASGKSANFEDIIGYNDNCAKISISEVTLVYSDGTSQTGHYGWRTGK